MVIRCNLIMCFQNAFVWCRVNGTDCIAIENEASDKLVISMNVTSAAEVGGQEYECHCSGDYGNCKKYNIAGDYDIWTVVIALLLTWELLVVNIPYTHLPVNGTDMKGVNTNARICTLLQFLN